jgi:two-component system response regulator DesR
MLLHVEPGLVVVGEASAGEELLARVRETGPDLLLLDTDLPGPSLSALLHDLHALNTRPTVIVLGARQEMAGDALAAGADAFFCQDRPPSSLLLTIRDIGPGSRS